MVVDGGGQCDGWGLLLGIMRKMSLFLVSCWGDMVIGLGVEGEGERERCNEEEEGEE